MKLLEIKIGMDGTKRKNKAIKCKYPGTLALTDTDVIKPRKRIRSYDGIRRHRPYHLLYMLALSASYRLSDCQSLLDVILT